MKFLKRVCACFLISLFIAAIVYGAWDKDKPAAGTSLRSSNPEMLANQTALETAFNREHEFSTGGTVADQMHHKQGSARAFFQDGAPQTRGDPDSTAFTSEDLGSLWFDTNASPDNEAHVLTATTPTWTGLNTEIIATMVAANQTFAGTVKSTGDFTVGANKVVVTAASGNTAVAGTLDVTGNTDPTTYETTNGGFLDEDDMASDAANKVASQQSIKAFNTWVPAVSGASAGYGGEESTTAANGFIIKGAVVTDAGTTGAVSFGTAFPNALLAVTLTQINEAEATSDIVLDDSPAAGTAGFSWIKGAGMVGFHWIAIGY